MHITKHTLSNGMNVLLCESHAAPVTSFNVLVCAGSAVETNAEAGLCHVIEHDLQRDAHPFGRGHRTRYRGGRRRGERLYQL